MTQQRPFCPYCQRFADQIPDVVAMSRVEKILPAEFAREDGTYNPQNGHFACTACYIELGMPSRPDGWICP